MNTENLNLTLPKSLTYLVKSDNRTCIQLFRTKKITFSVAALISFFFFNDNEFHLALRVQASSLTVSTETTLSKKKRFTPMFGRARGK